MDDYTIRAKHWICQVWLLPNNEEPFAWNRANFRVNEKLAREIVLLGGICDILGGVV